jgi:hypothetical protein
MEIVIEFLVKLNCFAKSYWSYALVHMCLIGNMHRSLTRKKGCRYLVLYSCVHLISIPLVANSLISSDSNFSCKQSWWWMEFAHCVQIFLNCLHYLSHEKNKMEQNQKYYPWEGSLSMKNIEISSMRRKWMNEEVWVAIHRRRLMNGRISRIYVWEEGGWMKKHGGTYPLRRRLMNEKAQSTYPREEGWWVKKH